MKRHDYRSLSPAQIEALCQRPVEGLADLLPVIREVFDGVAARGDQALRELTKRYDGVELGELRVSDAEFAEAERLVSDQAKSAIRFAAANVQKFHQAQLPGAIVTDTIPGVSCRREWRAIDRVGLYVPGGKAPLVSTVLMLGVPARIAGCREITLCTPPGPGGKIQPELLYAASLVGVRRVIKVGGSQAIAAMAIGTAAVPKVDKIFGPGNRYVTAAKAYAQTHMAGPGAVAIDMLAGPSELLVIADDSANPEWIAADLLSQAEHGRDSQVVLVALQPSVIDLVAAALDRQVRALPDADDRDDAEASLTLAYAVLAADRAEALAFSNAYAPEHLQIAARDAESWIPGVLHAGSVFVGANCSVVFGDYASGTNHTLPTAATARFSGGLTTESFMKPVSFQVVSAAALPTLAAQVTLLARIEGLEGHARASELREGGPKGGTA